MGNKQTKEGESDSKGNINKALVGDDHIDLQVSIQGLLAQRKKEKELHSSYIISKGHIGMILSRYSNNAIILTKFYL